MNALDAGIFANQTKNYDWNTSTANSKSLYKNDAEYPIDKDSWSLIIDEILLDCDDILDTLILASQTLPCLHSDSFCKPTLKHQETIV